MHRIRFGGGWVLILTFGFHPMITTPPYQGCLYWSQFLNSIGFLSRQHLVHACLKMSKPFFRIFTARLPHTCAIFSPVCDSTQIFRFLNFWTFFGTIRISTAKLSHTCARVSLVCDASFFKISIVLESLFFLESLDFFI